MLTYVTLLKITICSAIFVIYYYAVLRNKVYHQYNRFYLLFGVVFSWCLPFVNFQIFIEPQQTVQPVYKVIEFFSTSNIARPIQQNMPQSAAITAKNINLDIIVSTVFVLISVSLCVKFIYGLYVIFKLKQTNNKQSFSNINVYFTNEPNTPFSFLNSIFWNNNIDIESAIGKQVLAHELVHINQKHSYDKIAMQLCLIAGWFNPFFWILNKELGMIHEFIADKKSIPNANKAQFAQMLLSTNFVTKSPTFSNPFFLSPIKRRLNMLTKNKLPKFSYAQRILALPIFALLVMLYACKARLSNTKENKNPNIVISDLTLTKVNGIENIDTIKNDGLPAIYIDNVELVKDNQRLENSISTEELNEYKSYEKLVFTGEVENEKKYDYKKLSDEQKLRMNDLYSKMSLSQKIEVNLKAYNGANAYIKLKPTNALIDEWKKNDNFTFRIDNQDVKKSEIKDANEYIGYLKMATYIKSDDPSKTKATINFTSKERLISVAKAQHFYWVNDDALKTANNKMTKSELNEVLALTIKYNPFEIGEDLSEEERLRLKFLYDKMTEEQKAKSPVKFSNMLPKTDEKGISSMQIIMGNTF